jgi:pSer/pThr/pTyr-binding forkhead associated (FHA) protein
MNIKESIGIIIVVVVVMAVAIIFWVLNGMYGWLENQIQEIVIALIMAIMAGVLIESVYKRLQPQPKMLKTTQTHMVERDETSARLVLPNKSNIMVKDPEKIIGREDFLGVVTSDKLYFIGKYHLKITRKDNSFYIQDLNTKNGTTVNGTRLDAGQMHRLSDGDDIVIAKSLQLKYKVLGMGMN